MHVWCRLRNWLNCTKRRKKNWVRGPNMKEGFKRRSKDSLIWPNTRNHTPNLKEILILFSSKKRPQLKNSTTSRNNSTRLFWILKFKLMISNLKSNIKKNRGCWQNQTGKPLLLIKKNNSRSRPEELKKLRLNFPKKSASLNSNLLSSKNPWKKEEMNLSQLHSNWQESWKWKMKRFWIMKS